MTLRPQFFFVALLVALASSGCASLQGRDPLQVTLAGIEPMQGQGMELRLLVKLRVQNPNDAPVDYDGLAVELGMQGKTLATGVSDAAGSVPRFGESVIEVPVTISAFRMARQALGVLKGAVTGKINYQLKGKIHGAAFKTIRFQKQGEFGLPTGFTDQAG